MLIYVCFFYPDEWQGETKKLPPECRIQAMRHLSRPIVSVQFHPEQYTDSFPDGKRILENFFREVLIAR